MACITISHHIPFWASEDRYPHMRKDIQSIIKKASAFGSFGGLDLLPKKTHYSSLNIISVDDPRQYQNDYGVGVPLKLLVPKTRSQAELVAAGISELVSRDERAKLYTDCIKIAFPTMSTRFEGEREFADLYSVDITFIDQSGVSLVFLNKEEAQSVVDMIRVEL